MMTVTIHSSVIVILNALSVYCQQQCVNLAFNQTAVNIINQTLESPDLATGSCTLYNGTLCAGIITPNVDYVYLSYAHDPTGNLGAWTRFFENLNLLNYVQLESCKETMRQVLCQYYFPPCRNSSGYQLLASICKPGCLQIKNNLCPDDWVNVTSVIQRVITSRTRSRVLTDCSNPDKYLDSLPHCCVNLVDVPQASTVDTKASTATNLSPSSSGQTAAAGATSDTVSDALSVAITPTSTVSIITSNTVTLSTIIVGGSGNPPEAVGSVTGSVAGGVIGALAFLLLLMVAILVVLFVVKRKRKRRLSRGTLMTQSQRPSTFSSETNSIRKRSSDEILNDYSPDMYLHPNGNKMLRVPSGYLRQLSGKMLIPGDCLNVLDCIGQGEFGIVYRAYLSNWSEVTTPILVAVKTVKGQPSDSELAQMMEESIKMKDLTHPNILGLIGICIEQGPVPCIVMPFMANGSLLSYLKQQRNTLTIANGAEQDLIIGTQRILLPICLQIAKGMEYLSSQKFVHRDLAARNCMIDSNDVIKVADFGLSEDIYAKNYYRQGDSEENKVKLPIKWMAQESLHDGVFSEKSDVWSYGVTCWEVFTLGKIPYPGVTPFTLVKYLDEGGRLEKPSNAACSDEINAMMRRCWEKEPENRPHFWELVIDINAMLEAMADYLDLCKLPSTPKVEANQLPNTPIITITPA